jgi:hypothetical protein
VPWPWTSRSTSWRPIRYTHTYTTTSHTLGTLCPLLTAPLSVQLIVQRYRKGTRVWLFGLSRGAYLVRSVAGIINNLGILNISTDKRATVSKHTGTQDCATCLCPLTSPLL